jgi:hypothetical protein
MFIEWLVLITDTMFLTVFEQRFKTMNTLNQKQLMKHANQ